MVLKSLIKRHVDDRLNVVNQQLYYNTAYSLQPTCDLYLQCKLSPSFLMSIPSSGSSVSNLQGETPSSIRTLIIELQRS